jgi:hypothetical protein
MLPCRFASENTISPWSLEISETTASDDIWSDRKCVGGSRAAVWGGVGPRDSRGVETAEGGGVVAIS